MTVKKILENNVFQLSMGVITALCMLLAGYFSISVAPIKQDFAVEKAQAESFMDMHKDDVSRNEFNLLLSQLRSMDGKLDKLLEK